MSLGVDKVCGFLLIQSDWNSSLKDIGSRVWITTNHFGCDHVNNHKELCIKSYKDGDPVFEGPDHILVEQVSKYTITVSSSMLGVKTQFLAAVQEFQNIHKERITALDVTEGGGLGVSASLNGTCKIWETATGDIRRVLDGHIGDVNCCKFFPSGLVVLTGGMDSQLKIWSAVDGSCARTLNGSHKAGVMCVDFIDRGRNIVSCSRDGVVLLWDCGSASCICVLADGGNEADTVNCCQVIHSDKLANIEASKQQSHLEAGTDGKVVAVARQCGSLDCYNLYSKSVLSSTRHNSALNACCFINSNILVAGSQDGTILLLDCRCPKDFLLRLQPSQSPVLSLFPSTIRGGACFWVSCGNGRCSLYQLPSLSSPTNYRDGGLRLICELTGPDCDPVYQVVESSDGFVYTSCRDGVIRKYNLRLHL